MMMRKMINLISEERITLLSTNQDDDESGTSEFKMLKSNKFVSENSNLKLEQPNVSIETDTRKNNFMIKIM